MVNGVGTQLRRPRSGRPRKSAAQKVVIGILSTADHVRRSLTGVVEGHGLTLQQFNVLRILRGAGAEGLPTLQIGQRMVEKTPGLTGLLDRLLAKGLVARRRCVVDRRRVYCTITDRGLEILEALDGPVDLWEHAVVEGLLQEDLQLFLKLQSFVGAKFASPKP